MILKKLIVEGIGPFYEPTEVEIDPRVTVLTGRNDVGKSALLKLVNIMLSGKVITEDDVNINRIFNANRDWQKDEGIKCQAVFEVRPASQDYFADPLQSGTEVTIDFLLARNFRKIVSIKRGNTVANPRNHNVNKMPAPIFISSEDYLPSRIKLKTTDPLEQSFLTLAFGENFIGKLDLLSPERIKYEVKSAKQRINNHLSNLLPYQLGLEFDFDYLNGEEIVFLLGMSDNFGTDTPLHFRGAGVRKIMSILVSLLRVLKPSQEQYIFLLLDEPENSLHADMQHRLRELLERLASSEYIQVMYATHSPSMINTVDPSGLRLLSRESLFDISKSKINNRPFAQNYYPVRISLGITASDSLLYAPIAVIVEGITEILSLPFLLLRLQDEIGGDFKAVSELLSQCHFIDGRGDNFEFIARLAKGQGSKPIIFVDGDKVKRISQSKVREEAPDVPIVILEEGTEFEQLVPEIYYFQALDELFEFENSNEQYQTWIKTNKIAPQMAFTKRVDLWIKSNHPNKKVDYDKPRVMRRAVELAPVNEIILTPFRELISKIKVLLYGSLDSTPI